MGKARKNNYTASLTAESFLYDETRTLAEFLSEGSDAETISKRNLAENLISCKRPGALKRLNLILTDRLSEMTDDTLEPLLNNDINRTVHSSISTAHSEVASKIAESSSSSGSGFGGGFSSGGGFGGGGGGGRGF